MTTQTLLSSDRKERHRFPPPAWRAQPRVTYARAARCLGIGYAQKADHRCPEFGTLQEQGPPMRKDCARVLPSRTGQPQLALGQRRGHQRDAVCAVGLAPHGGAIDQEQSRAGAARAGLGDGLPLSIIEFGRLTRRLAIEETARTSRVEAQYPVADDLKTNPANLGRFGPCGTLVNCRQRQQPASLRPVLALPCQNAKLRRIEVAAQRDRSRHDEPPRFAMLNLTRKPFGNRPRVTISGTWYKPFGLVHYVPVSTAVTVFRSVPD